MFWSILDDSVIPPLSRIEEADGLIFYEKSSAKEALQTISKFRMAYLYGGTAAQQIAKVDAAGFFNTVSPAYFDIDASGSLSENGISRTLIDAMHQRGTKVVPLLSNHWNRRAGELALQQAERLSTQVINAVEQYNLDGVHVDIENVSAEYRELYTDLVRVFRQKLPTGKEVSVAVAANPDGQNDGWLGSYDYAGLAAYADYLVIMAYDEHWLGSTPGPVAGDIFIRRSIQYALTQAPANKLVLGIPLYGRIWGASGSFNGEGVGLNALNMILDEYTAAVTYDAAAKAPTAVFTVTPSDNPYQINEKVLVPDSYTVWFENEQSLQSKIHLVYEYSLKGMGFWTVMQASDYILQYFLK